MKNFIPLIAILLSANFALAQYDLISYGSRAAVASNMANPAMDLDGELTFSMLLFNSYYASFTSSISPNDFLAPQGDNTWAVSLPQLLGNLTERNIIAGEFNADPFYAGWRSKNQKAFMSVGYKHFIKFRADLTDDFIGYLGEGNAAYLDQTLTFDDEQLGLLHYQKVHFGYSYPVMKNMRIGARVNLLGGFNHFNPEKFSATVRTDSNSFPAYATSANIEFEANAGGIVGHLSDPDTTYRFGGDQFTGLGVGGSLDLGVDYQFHRNFGVSLSGNDLFGFIKWKPEFSRKITMVGDGQIEFAGFDVSLTAENTSEEIKNQVNELEEEIKSELDYNVEKKSFKSSVGSSFLLAGHFYSNDQKHEVIGMLSGVDNFGRTNYQAGAVYHYQPTKWVQLSSSYLWMKDIAPSVGLGATFQILTFQLHLSTNNIIPVFAQDDFGHTSVRLGMNFVYPKKKIVEPNLDESEEVQDEEVE